MALTQIDTSHFPGQINGDDVPVSQELRRTHCPWLEAVMRGAAAPHTPITETQQSQNLPPWLCLPTKVSGPWWQSASLRSCGKSAQPSDPGLSESCSLGNKSHHGDHNPILALPASSLSTDLPCSIPGPRRRVGTRESSKEALPWGGELEARPAREASETPIFVSTLCPTRF